jgi:Tfp pilus assembly protein PilV
MKHNTLIHGKTRNSMSGAGGFSLIEMLIGSVVFVVVLLAILMILDISQRDYASGAAKSDVQENVRVALESMARELRMAGYARSSTPNSDCAAPPCGVTALTSSSVTFQADVDGNPPDVCAVPPCMDKVIYTFDPPTAVPPRPCDPSDSGTVGRITRSVQSWVGGGWTTLIAYDVAQCVKTMTITYYNSAGGAAATPADVRRIKISITGEENVRGYTPRAYTLSTDVRLRNL